MHAYKALAILLTYPEPEWLDELPLLERAIRDFDRIGRRVEKHVGPLFDHLKSRPLIELQEVYVDTFDRTPSHALHLYEHIHGESRDRGTAMVQLTEEYRKYGLEISARELPDYLPMFLEFLSLIPGREATRLLSEAIDVIELLRSRLEKAESPYAGPLAALVAAAPKQPNPLTAAPKPMESLMRRFGRRADGAEPLLTPASQVEALSREPGTEG